MQLQPHGLDYRCATDWFITKLAAKLANTCPRCVLVTGHLGLDSSEELVWGAGR